jgi:hypothetical protein
MFRTSRGSLRPVAMLALVSGVAVIVPSLIALFAALLAAASAIL